MIVSRDVVFNEEACWDWKNKPVQRFPLHVNNDIEVEENEEEGIYTPPQSPQVASPSTPQSHQAASSSTSRSQTSSPSSILMKIRNLSGVCARCNFYVIEPESFKEAVNDVAWKKAMDEEIFVIEKNSTWELMDRPSDKDVIGVKCIYKTKLNLDGSIQKNKARLVAKGYSQKSSVDFHETFASVARLDTIRILIALAAQKGWFLHQLDVKSTFLNGVLNEDVYVHLPQGFVIKEEEMKVYKLNKEHYGLKQAPRAWYGEIDAYFINNGFQRS